MLKTMNGRALLFLLLLVPGLCNMPAALVNRAVPEANVEPTAEPAGDPAAAEAALNIEPAPELSASEPSASEAEIDANQNGAQEAADSASVADAPEPPSAQYSFSQPETNVQLVYGDALPPTWQNWSWGINVDFESGTTVQDGTAAMAVTYNEGWTALYLHTDEHIAGDEFDALRFWIHGGKRGGQQIQVVLADESNSFLSDSVAVSAPADGWTPVEIRLSDLGSPRRISGIGWQDTTGGAQPTFYIDSLSFVDLNLPPTPTSVPVAGPALRIDAAAERHPISPDIYGVNYADEELAVAIDLPVRRWGGNATTRYNWQNDTANRASDWFFENIPEEHPNPDELPSGSSAERFIEQDQRIGTKTLLTVPLIGWTPKSRERSCGFSVEKYGPQQYTDSWQPDCGNGVTPGGKVITGNDPTDTSTAIDPSFVEAWIQHLTARFGTAAEGGVAFYSLDNEPMLWNHTHRDVHPEPVSYDELVERTLEYAPVIKRADPTAQTVGPALWGWTAYFFSALDQEKGGNWWNNAPDRAAHGDLPLVVWYLQKMREYEEETGLRVLDYLDLHYYTQAPGVALTTVGDQGTRALRLRSTRSLWDPTYTDESWIDEPVRLIPRMREWVDEHYPGTKLALTEYNFGGLEHINGALAQADVLGIFGREGLDLATLWAPTSSDDPFAFAFRMYRNYDGAGAKFGDMSIEAVSTDQDALSIYAAIRQSDGALTVMVINKTNDTLDSPLSLVGVSAQVAQVYRYGADNPFDILQLADQAVAGDEITVSFPGNTITLLVLPTTS